MEKERKKRSIVGQREGEDPLLPTPANTCQRLRRRNGLKRGKNIMAKPKRAPRPSPLSTAWRRPTTLFRVSVGTSYCLPSFPPILVPCYLLPSGPTQRTALQTSPTDAKFRSSAAWRSSPEEKRGSSCR